MPKYTKAQFVAFQVKPGVKNVLGVKKYLGEADAGKDIDVRCKFMVDAIVKAHRLVTQHTPPPPAVVARGVSNSVNTEPVLKILMAPEFYFRNEDGAYPIEMVHKIMEEMRKETNKREYKDWLFVFGTAIGYLKHPQTIFRRIRSVEKDGGGFSVLDVGELPHKDWVDADVELHPSAKIAAVARGMGNELRLALDRDPGLKAGDAVHFNGAGNTTNQFALKAAGPDSASRPSVTFEQAIQNPCPRCKHTAYDGALDTCTTCKHTHRAANAGDYVFAVNAVSKAKVTDVNEKLTLDSQKDYAPGDCIWLKRPGAKPGVTEVFNIAMIQRGGPDTGRGERREAIVFKEYVSQIDFLGPNAGNVSAFNTPAGRIIEIHGENRAVLPTTGSQHAVGPVSNEPNEPGVLHSWVDYKGIAQNDYYTEINEKDGGGGIFTIEEIAFGVEVCLDHLMKRLRDYYDYCRASGDPVVQIHLIPSWGMTIKASSMSSVDGGLVFNVDGSRNDSSARINSGDFGCETHYDVKSGVAGPCLKCRIFYCAAHNAITHEVFTKASDKCSMCTAHLAAYDPPDCALTRLGAPIATVAGPVSIPSSLNWGDYFESPGQIVLYETQPIPPAQTVP